MPVLSSSFPPFNIRESIVLIVPDSYYRGSFPIAVIPDISNRESILGSFRIDPRQQPARMTNGGNGYLPQMRRYDKSGIAPAYHLRGGCKKNMTAREILCSPKRRQSFLVLSGNPLKTPSYSPLHAPCRKTFHRNVSRKMVRISLLLKLTFHPVETSR